MGVFSEIKPKNSARKNPFDLSCFSTYNTKAGLLLPLKFWPTIPNSEYSLDIKALMRTQPLATAAFAGFSINYDVVWSPYNDHYSSFNQFIAQRLNRQHVTQPPINVIPAFNLGLFVRYLLCGALFDSFLTDYPTSKYYELFNNQDTQISMPLHGLYYAESLPSQSMCLSALRTLDLLGYGNYLPVLKAMKTAAMRYLDQNTLYADTDDMVLPYSVRWAARFSPTYYQNGKIQPLTYREQQPARIVEPSDYPASIYLTFVYNFIFAQNNLAGYGCNIVGLIPISKYHTLWPVFTYNKAFWQFYRNEYFDIDFTYFVWNDNENYEYVKTIEEYVKLFNYDDLVSGTIFDTFSASIFERLLSMFAVKPHQYKKDLFTGIMPSTQYGNVSVASTSPEWFEMFYRDVSSSVTQDYKVGRNNSSSNVGIMPLLSNGGSPSNTNVSKYDSAKFRMNPQLSVDVLELRKADSLQRFRERMLRAGNKTKDIFVAHGWEEPLSEKAFDVQFFGNFDGRLDLNVVAATSESTNDDGQTINLGQLAANGVSAISGQTIHFKSHDFGTLMVIAYITKDAIYDAYGVEKSHSLLEAFDFPYPELQNVSLAPVSEEQLSIYGTDNYSSVLGYLPQNMVYKTAVDKVHGEFYSVNPLQSVFLSEVLPVGIFANMVTPRADIDNPKSLAFLYVQPECADNIFVQNANGNQDTDQFFANVRFDLKCVQPLDVIGLPI